MTSSHNRVHKVFKEAVFLKKLRADLKNTAAGLPSPVHLIPFGRLPGQGQYGHDGLMMELNLVAQKATEKLGGKVRLESGGRLYGNLEVSLGYHRESSILIMRWDESSHTTHLDKLVGFLDARKCWGSHWINVPRNLLDEVAGAIKNEVDVLPDDFYTIVDPFEDQAKKNLGKALGLKVKPARKGIFGRLFGRS